MDFAQAQNTTLHYAAMAASEFQRLPGSAILLRYIKSSYQNDPVRSAIEAMLVIFAIRYMLAPSYSTKKREQGAARLTEEEIDDLVEDWVPEPITAEMTVLEERERAILNRSVIDGQTGPKCKLTNGKVVTNLASYNFYNFVGNESLKEKAVQVLRNYGVGPCGPPGFYGTQDVHIATESDIAAHLGVPACIVYAQAFSTISSVIPAFSKRGDIIVADESVNYAIRKGLQISRSTVYFYKHNDMQDLERCLAKVVKEQAKKPLTRRFIVTEGLFENVGDMADLPTLVKLKHQYKFRLILDETWSYGVLGNTGRGLSEEQNVETNEIDMLIGSLAGPLCAGGGFCAGSREVVEHQRISAAAYTFSAALPAILSTTASETIRMRQESPTLWRQLQENIKLMWLELDPRSLYVNCTSARENPIMLLVLKPDVVEQKQLSYADQEAIFQDVIDECITNGVLITRLKAPPRMLGSSARLEKKEWQPTPALKVCLTVGLSAKEVPKAGREIRHAITKVVKNWKR